MALKPVSSEWHMSPLNCIYNAFHCNSATVLCFNGSISLTSSACLNQLHPVSAFKSTFLLFAQVCCTPAGEGWSLELAILGIPHLSKLQMPLTFMSRLFLEHCIKKYRLSYSIPHRFFRRKHFATLQTQLNTFSLKL